MDAGAKIILVGIILVLSGIPITLWRIGNELMEIRKSLSEKE